MKEVNSFPGWRYLPWQVWPPTWGWLTSMAPPMCWQSTRSGWWSPSDGWPSWPHGSWTFASTKPTPLLWTSASRDSKRKCSFTFFPQFLDNFCVGLLTTFYFRVLATCVPLLSLCLYWFFPYSVSLLAYMFIVLVYVAWFLANKFVLTRIMLIMIIDF